MRAVIIDDEVDARKSTRYYIDKYLPECEIVGEADGVSSGVQCIQDSSPDVVFLDINLGGGSGFDLLNQLEHRDFQLIFVTGYDEFAIKAFKYSAIDYLLKPIDSDDFILLQQKLNTKVESGDMNDRLDILESQMNRSGGNTIALPHQDGIQYVELEDIIHLESDGNYTMIQLASGKKITVTRLIGDFEDMLDADIFMRTHKSHIINISQVDRYNKSDEVVVMKNGTAVPLARRRKKDLLKRLK